MPSRAYTSFLHKDTVYIYQKSGVCQCPLGLIPHFYCMDSTGLMPMRTRVSMPSRAYTSFLLCSLQAILQYLYSCQCPLGLIPHFYIKTLYTSIRKAGCVNALSGLYLISTVHKELLYATFVRVSMPSRAYTSFLRYPFKNIGFMRFPEPVFAGIYQNILTTAVFRAC